jgi:hypothetical protein
MSNKRATTVGILTAGIAASILATTVGPAAAQGNPVGGKGNVYFLSGAVNSSGQAQQTFGFGDPGDEVFFGDWDNEGVDLPMVRRGNVFYVSSVNNPNVTASVFAYGDAGDTVVIGDWNGDGYDSIAIRRGNHFFVKNDNFSTGKADSEFFYGDAGDKILVGNWNGVTTTATSAGIDYNGDGDFTDPATPAYAADLTQSKAGIDNTVPKDGDFVDVAATPPTAGQPTSDVAPVTGTDLGFDANKNGDYTDAGDRQPGTGVDNNGDGDFTDPATPARPAEVAPGTAGKGDTIMIQRGNQFFVKNSISTGIADYTFYYGDAGDNVLVGDWATPAMPETATSTAKPAVSGDGADQLAVRRGNTFYASTELAAARTAKTNPTAGRVFSYGEPADTVFVASLPSQPVDQFGRPVIVNDPATTVDETAAITGDGLGVRR